VLSLVGIGLFISSLARTQQQAILGVFVFMVPAVTLSGFSAPVENMPPFLQYATWVNPLKHALVMVRGLFLKDMSLGEIWIHLWPLLVIGGVTLGLASWFFVRRLE
jgi:ABC-2 type transport system permease protein